ncbi:MAG: CNNM domain-containing protein [Planctomycetota bacterium]
MLVALTIFAVGLALSAFFSGSETGFYRVARVRLLIDALTGSRLAKGLLWASNNPAAFVATALVGNNVANNCTTLAITLAASIWLPGFAFAGILLTLAATPLLFILGELLPKKLFFRAPYRMLKRCAPALAVAGVLFLPFSLLLVLVSRVLQKITRAPSQTIRMTLARRELGEVLDEGHAAGLLTPAQRSMAQNAFSLGDRPVGGFVTPAARVPRAAESLSRRELLKLASRHKLPVVPVHSRAGDKKVTGCVAAVDCLLDPDKPGLPVRPLAIAQQGESYLSVLLRVQKTGASLLAIHGAGEQVVGFVTAERLREALLEEA